MSAWARLTPDERRIAREQFKTLRQLPPEQRQEVRQKWQEYQQLPPEKRRELASTLGRASGDRRFAAPGQRQLRPPRSSRSQPVVVTSPLARRLQGGMSPRAGLRRRLAASVYEALLLAALALLVGFALLPVLGPGPPPAGRRAAASRTRRARDVVRRAVRGARRLLRLGLERRTAHAADEDVAHRHGVGVGTSQSASPGRRCAIAPGGSARRWPSPPTRHCGPSGYRRWALALLALNYAWALVDSDRQFLHDRIARTRLTLAG